MSRKSSRYRMVLKMVCFPEDLFSLEPCRPPSGPSALLNRYQVQLVHFRYRIRWMKVSDIGGLWPTSCRWTI